MVDTKVTYTMEYGGKFFIVENVSARVCRQTGEQIFAPETLEHIQGIIKSRECPERDVETPVDNEGPHHCPAQPLDGDRVAWAWGLRETN